MGIIDLIDAGFFEGFWNWTNPTLSAAMYFCAAIGFIIQLVLQNKCQICCTMVSAWTLSFGDYCKRMPVAW